MNIGRESETVEFKKSTSELKEAMDDVCAILNKHGQGILYFGVKPNGDVCGQEIGSNTLDDIARSFKNAIQPMVFPTIKEIKLTDTNTTYIEVDFKGTEKPYTSYGRFYERIVDRSEQMTPSEIKSMMMESDIASQWENSPTKYGLESLDHEALKRYYNKAVSCGRLEPLIPYNEEDLLIGLGLFENKHFNNAGYYLFSNRKPVALKLAVFVSDERLNFLDIKRQEDNIYNLLDYAFTYIKEKINWSVTGLSGTSRIETPEIPVEAIREIIVNSFAHADYRGITEHEIDITPTQIEIFNPGPFPHNLNPEIFVRDRRKSQPRNKTMLNTLFKSKDVEMFGTGLKKVFAICNDNNCNISYRSNEDGFSFIFYRRKIEIKVQNKVQSSASDDSSSEIGKNGLKILQELKSNPTLTAENIAILIGVSRRTVMTSLKDLQQKSFIKRVGSKKSGYWEVIE